MINFISALSLVACLLFAGCATSPIQSLPVGDCGPVPKNADVIARAYILSSLKDPDSAQFRNGVLRKGWVRDGLLYGGAYRFGWIYSVDLNAKNSYGGYAGYEEQHIFIHNGSRSDVTAKFKYEALQMAGFILDQKDSVKGEPL